MAEGDERVSPCRSARFVVLGRDGGSADVLVMGRRGAGTTLGDAIC